MAEDRDSDSAHEDRTGRRHGTPPDVVDPPHQQHPHTAAEASADLEMAEAEEAVGRGDGSDDQRESVSQMAAERGQEDRRQVWMDRHTGPAEPDQPR